MNMPCCVLRAHEEKHRATVRVEGRATMNQCPAVRRFAQQCMEHGVETLQMDLAQCTYMDSTFLGTLLYLQRATQQRGHGEFMLLCPSSECSRLLEQMGLLDIFPVAHQRDPAEDTWVQLGEENADRKAFQWNVVQAHQELANLEGSTGDSFRSLATALAMEIDARR